jgi:hypothetical protein
MTPSQKLALERVSKLSRHHEGGWVHARDVISFRSVNIKTLLRLVEDGYLIRSAIDARDVYPYFSVRLVESADQSKVNGVAGS